MARISRSFVLKSALISILIFGEVPLMLAPVEAGHGGGGGGSSQSGAKATKATKTTKTKSEIAVPAPVAPQPPRLQGIQFTPDSRCARLTESQRRQTPGCGYN
jgi:hypothetical protein